MIFRFNPKSARSCRARVFLDGRPLYGVVLADTEAGTIYRLAELEGGGLEIARAAGPFQTCRFYCDEYGDYVLERLTGEVRVEFRSPAAGSGPTSEGPP